MRIITGHTGEKHIYAIDDAAVNKLLVGNGAYVLPFLTGTAQPLNLSITDAHTVSIGNGYLMMQGRLAVIRPGEDETFDLTHGSPGYFMSCLIVAEYTVDSEGIEDISLKVLEGGLSETDPPDDPSLTTGDIDSGQTHQVALWRVILDGQSIDRIERVTQVVSVAPIDELYTRLTTMEATVAQAIDDMNASADEAIADIQQEAETAINGWKGYYYTSGSEVDAVGTVCIGEVTSSSKRLYFTIPSKPISGSSVSVTINSLKPQVRMATGGYVHLKRGKNFDPLSDGSIQLKGNAAVKTLTATVYNGQIRVFMETKDAMLRADKKTAVLNNTPVVVYLTEAKFTIN